MSGLDVEPTDEEAEAGDDAHTIEVTPTDEVDAEPDERERIDVEPTDEPVDGPEYVLYGGKGGVGKTTMAAATALDSARSGVRTLVVSTDPAHSLSDTFETDVPARPERIREDVPLYAAEIDPETAMEDGAAAFPGAGGASGGAAGGASGGAAGGASSGGGTGPAGGAGGDADESSFTDSGPFGAAGASDAEGRPGSGAGDPAGAGGGPMGGQDGGPMGGMMGEMGDLLGGESPIEAMFGGAMPGADEAAAMQLLLQYLDDDRFDRVIVDTAPTGHTLRLLELPELMDSMMGKMLKFRERIGGMIEGVKGLFGGGPDPAEQGPGIEDLEELRDRIERLRAALRDPARTDFRIVLVPEEMSVLESKRLRTQLDEFGIPVGTVVVNRVMEPLADVAADVDDSDFLEPNLDDCEFCQRRWDVQQSALGEAQELFRGTDVRRVPLFADEVRGEAMLSVVAACLR